MRAFVLTISCMLLPLAAHGAENAKPAPIAGNPYISVSRYTDPVVKVTYDVDFSNPAARDLYVGQDADDTRRGIETFACEQQISIPKLDTVDEKMRYYKAVTKINGDFEKRAKGAQCPDSGTQFTLLDYEVVYGSLQFIGFSINGHSRASGGQGGSACGSHGVSYDTYNLNNGSRVLLGDIIPEADRESVTKALLKAAGKHREDVPEKDHLWKESFAIARNGIVIKDLDCGDEDGKNITRLILNKEFIGDKTILNEIEAYNAR